MRILLVENNVAATHVALLALSAGKMVVDHVALGRQALGMVPLYDYDVVLTALTLPDLDGLELVRRMRKMKQSVPVLIMSPNTAAEKKVLAFNVGADDFIVTPVDESELIARIRALARRSRSFSDPTIKTGKLQINLQSSNVSVNGISLHLTCKEFAILELLVMRKGMVLSKDVFLDHLYNGMDEPEGKIIDVFICKLRKKLEEVGVSKLIMTVWGRGYVLREQEVEFGAIGAVTGSVAPQNPAYVG